MPAAQRGRWLALALLVAVAEACLFAQAWGVDARLENVSRKGPLALPAPAPRILGSNGDDEYQWIRLTREAMVEGRWRLRRCDYENAPIGRDVYWSSGLSSWLRMLAHLHPGTSKDLRSLEWAATWANPLLLMLLMPVIVAFASRRWGAAAGAALVAFMLGNPGFRTPFTPARPDHHGLIALAALGTVLGILGADAATNRRARRVAMAASAVAGAVGMWTSAVSQSVVLTLVACGVLAAGWLAARTGTTGSMATDAGAWRLWGRIGATASLLFYFGEQFPDRLGMRLEVDHPLHALAWLGGAELLALVAQRSTPAAHGGVQRPIGRWLLAVVAVALLPLAILVGGTRWFAVADPALHRLVSMIVEYRPVWSIVHLMRPEEIALLGVDLLLLLVAGWLVARRSLAGETRVALLMALVPASAFFVLAAFQLRWSLVGAGVEAVLLVVVVSALFAAFVPERTRPARLVLLLCLPLAWSAVSWTVMVAGMARRSPHSVSPAELSDLVARDVARTLREDAGEAPVTILSSPDLTVRVSYFGGFRGLGTPYWENIPGLAAAGAIWQASFDEALPLLLERGVTHVVLVRDGTFLDGWGWLVGEDASADESFGRRLIEKGEMPLWLQPVPHPHDELMRATRTVVRLFRVAPEQTPAEAQLHLALWQQSEGNDAAAEASYRAALRLAPDDGAAHEGLGLLLLDAGRESEGIAELALAVSSQPVSRRAEIAAVMATKIGDAARIDALAAALPRSLDEGGDVLLRFAWILSTSSLAGARDGRRALALVEEATRRGLGDSSAWRIHDVRAAALAESGDLAAARHEIDAALETAGDASPLREALRARRDCYARDEPWRE